MNLLKTLFNMQLSGGLFILKDDTRINVKKVTGSVFKKEVPLGKDSIENEEKFFILYIDDEGVSRQVLYSDLKEARPLGLDYELPTRRDEAPCEYIEDELPEVQENQSIYDIMKNVIKMKANGGTLILNDGRTLFIDPVIKVEELIIYFKGIRALDDEEFDDIDNLEFNSLEDPNVKIINLLAVKEAHPDNVITSRGISNSIVSSRYSLETDSDSDSEKNLKKRKRFVVPLLDDELVDMLNTTREQNYSLLEPYYIKKQRVEITSHKVPKSIYTIVYMFKTEQDYFAILLTDEHDMFHLSLSELFVVKPVLKMFYQERPVHISNKSYWKLTPFSEDCFLHEKTGLVLSVKNNIYYLEGVLGDDKEDMDKIRDWVSACGILLYQIPTEEEREEKTLPMTGLPICKTPIQPLMKDTFSINDNEFINEITPYLKKCFAIEIDDEVVFNNFVDKGHKHRLQNNVIKQEILRDFHDNLLKYLLISETEKHVDIYMTIPSPYIIRIGVDVDIKLTFFASQEYIETMNKHTDYNEEEHITDFFERNIGNIVSFEYKEEPKNVLIKVANDKYAEGICQESNSYKKYLMKYIQCAKVLPPSTPIKKREMSPPRAPRKVSRNVEEQTYKDSVLKAIKELNYRGGVSRPAINEYLNKNINYYTPDSTDKSIRALLEDGYIVQNNQRFKLTKKADEFFKVFRQLEFPTTSEFEKVSLIYEAVKEDKSLNIKYEGGSISGIIRPIKPIRIFKTKTDKTMLEATCLIEDATRRFDLTKVSIM